MMIHAYWLAITIPAFYIVGAVTGFLVARCVGWLE